MSKYRPSEHRPLDLIWIKETRLLLPEITKELEKIKKELSGLARATMNDVAYDVATSQMKAMASILRRIKKVSTTPKPKKAVQVSTKKTPQKETDNFSTTHSGIKKTNSFLDTGFGGPWLVGPKTIDGQIAAREKAIAGLKGSNVADTNPRLYRSWIINHKKVLAHLRKINKGGPKK
jgi:hypothetical protein